MFCSMREIRSVSNCSTSGDARSFISAPLSSSASLRPLVEAGPLARKSNSSCVPLLSIAAGAEQAEGAVDEGGRPAGWLRRDQG